MPICTESNIRIPLSRGSFMIAITVLILLREKRLWTINIPPVILENIIFFLNQQRVLKWKAETLNERVSAFTRKVTKITRRSGLIIVICCFVFSAFKGNYVFYLNLVKALFCVIRPFIFYDVF